MAPASKLGRGKPLKNQTKEVLHKIYKYFESEISRDPNSTVTAAQLVTHSTGISMNALKRVLNEHKANAAIKKEFTTNRRRCKKNITSDDFDAQAIRRIIHNFYTGDEEFPIMKDLYMIMKADIDYQGSLCTLRRHVAKLGFKWMEKDDNNSVLVEKHDVRFARVQYLSRIECYRSQGRNIVYTSKAAIKSSRISSKPKAGGSTTVLKQPAKSRLVILLAGDQNNLMKNTMYMFDGNKRELKEELESKRDNFDQYERWFRHQLIPILKPNSIVVVDGGSAYHSRLSNPAPHSNSRKKEMMDYLTARSVPHSADMYKAQLYQLVLNNKDRCNDYKTDFMLREHGHTVLRIPAHHPDLNPIHVVLNSLQNYVGLDVCLPVDSMMKISKERILSLDQNDWTHACKMVEAEENSLKSTDKVIDDILETTFRNVEDSEDSESDDESEQESGDSE